MQNDNPNERVVGTIHSNELPRTFRVFRRARPRWFPPFGLAGGLAFVCSNESSSALLPLDKDNLMTFEAGTDATDTFESKSRKAAAACTSGAEEVTSSSPVCDKRSVRERAFRRLRGDLEACRGDLEGARADFEGARGCLGEQDGGAVCRRTALRCIGAGPLSARAEGPPTTISAASTPSAAPERGDLEPALGREGVSSPLAKSSPRRLSPIRCIGLPTPGLVSRPSTLLCMLAMLPVNMLAMLPVIMLAMLPVRNDPVITELGARELSDNVKKSAAPKSITSSFC